jgi:hypothetical protein
MSISSIAEETALRLTTPPVRPPSVATIATTATATTAAAVSAGTPQEAAIQAGHQAAEAEQGSAAPASVESGPLAQLVKYVPTETITLYIAVQAAVGDIVMPKSGKISDANFASRWVWMWLIFGVTIILTTGLSYRSQKNVNSAARFKVPFFDVAAAGVAFLVWALSLPSTPLRDVSGYNYGAWNSVLILGGTVAIASAAYVLGKTVSWHKVLDA